jgi:hypothetical protein
LLVLEELELCDHRYAYLARREVRPGTDRLGGRATAIRLNLLYHNNHRASRMELGEKRAYHWAPWGGTVARLPEPKSVDGKTNSRNSGAAAELRRAILEDGFTGGAEGCGLRRARLILRSKKETEWERRRGLFRFYLFLLVG